MHDNEYTDSDISDISREELFTQLAMAVADQAFQTIEDVRSPDEWMNDDETQVTLTRSVSDWTYFFLGLQTLVGFAVDGCGNHDVPGGDHRTALHVSHILSELTADLVAAVQPVEEPATEERELALNAT